jgi:hypothetical protein
MTKHNFILATSIAVSLFAIAGVSLYGQLHSPPNPSFQHELIVTFRPKTKLDVVQSLMEKVPAVLEEYDVPLSVAVVSVPDVARVNQVFLFFRSQQEVVDVTPDVTPLKAH